MSHPVIEADECLGCGICVDACPQEVLEVVGGTADVVNEEACIACGDCVEECPMVLSPRLSKTNGRRCAVGKSDVPSSGCCGRTLVIKKAGIHRGISAFLRLQSRGCKHM